MIPLLSQVYARARETLGDTEVSGGQLWTDERLQEHAGAAYEAMYRALSMHGSKALRRTAYYNVPASQSYLTPAQMGLTNFSEPKAIYERLVNLAVSPNSGTPGDAYLTLGFATAHGFVDGQSVVVYGMQGISEDANDMWAVAAPTTATLRLMGCRAAGTFASGAVVSDSTEAFPSLPMAPYNDILDYPTTPGSQLTKWTWEKGVIRFWPCSTARQIRLIYTLSGAPPSDAAASMGVDDSLDFLANFTAGLAVRSKGMGTTAATLLARACGNPTGDCSRANAGLLGELVRHDVKNLQVTGSFQIPRFRPKRNVGGNCQY